EMIRLASESMERFPSEERDITALVLSVRPDRMGEIKQKTAEFRKALLEIATETEDPDQVVQVNIQVFPLTRKK
ncbi:MAG: TIGR02147 family protein, partial [Thermodesulfobacteriota bacterium]